MLALGSSNSSVPCQWGALSLLCTVRISYLRRLSTPKETASEGRKALRQFFRPMGVY
jgi:hypothetical protein